MNRKLRTLIIILMAVAGIGLFAYPAFSNYLFEQNASKAAENYDQVVEQADPAKLEQALVEAIKYNEGLAGNPVHDPFLKGSGMALGENYMLALNLDGRGIMGYVSIPKIGVRLSVRHGTSDAVLQNSTGHLEGSSLPIGGPGCHSVITGHTGLAHAKMFTDLARLREGDMFYLRILGETLAYQVDQVKVVLPEVISDLERVPDKDYCTLLTCTPYGINSHRLLVRGERVPYVEEDEQKLIAESRAMPQWFTGWNVIIGATVGLVFALAVILLFLLKRKREKEEERRTPPQPIVEGSENPWELPVLQALPVGGKKKRRRRGKKPRYWWDE